MRFCGVILALSVLSATAAAHHPSSAAAVTPAPRARLSIAPSVLPAAGGVAVISFAVANATSCRLVAQPSLWPRGRRPALPGCAGTLRVHVGATTVARTWKVSFTAAAGGRSATAAEVLRQQAPVETVEKSSNWSGYVVSGVRFTAVGGEWVVPRLDCSSPRPSGVGSWVGIGGLKRPGKGAPPLLQTGIRSECLGGSQTNVAWWEDFPVNAAQDFTNFPVSAGDLVDASVFETRSGAWATKVVDVTTGTSGVMTTGGSWGVSVGSSFAAEGSANDVSYAGADTAEWIVEDYARDRTEHRVPLAVFTPVRFTKLVSSPGVTPHTRRMRMKIVQHGITLSEPTALATSGFAVAYTG